MNKYKLQLSEGFQVIKGEQLSIEENLKNNILKLYSLYGYEQIKTPTLEYSDVFCDNMQKPELYSLINRHGEVLALSYDMTSSIARFISSSKMDDGPLRYSYYADVFRYPRLYQGRSHEFSQIGLELVNTDSFDSDVEIISLAYLSIKLCKLENFKIHLSSTKFLVDLFTNLGFTKTTIADVFDLIEQKNFVLLKETLALYLEDYLPIYNLIINGGDYSYLKKLILEFKDNSELLYLEKLYLALTKIDVKNIYFDFAIASYARYYTGIVFQIFADGISESVLDGGRYDNLYKAFYKDYKACGFGLNLSVVSSYLVDNNETNDVIYYLLSDSNSFGITYCDSIKLRSEGFKVVNLFDMDYLKAKEMLKNKKYKLRIYKNNEMREE